VLAVIHHQQQCASGAQEFHDAAGHRDARLGTHPQGGQDGLRHRLLVIGRVELAQPRAITEGRHLVCRGAQRKTRLADPADAGHRHQRRSLHRRGQTSELFHTADEWAELNRQVPRGRIDRFRPGGQHLRGRDPPARRRHEHPAHWTG
jgi:hypothetical protein